MSRLLKILSFVIGCWLLINLIIPPSVSAAAAIGTHLSEGDITAQIEIINMLISKGATPEHPLTGMVFLGTPVGELNKLCSAMTRLTANPILRIAGIGADTIPLFPSTTAIANTLNSSTCPRSSFVVFANELNEPGDTDYIPNLSMLLAGERYTLQFAIFRRTLDPTFRLSAAPINIFRPDNSASQLFSGLAAKTPWQNSTHTACNVYEAAGFPPDILQTCQVLEQMTSAPDHPNLYPEYGPDPKSTLQQHLDWYAANPSPPYPTTTLVPNRCRGTASGNWLYYVQEVHQVFDINGTPVTADCQLDTTPFVHPENETDIASSYVVTCGTTRSLDLTEYGSPTICSTNFGCNADLDVSAATFLENLTIPWFGQSQNTSPASCADSHTDGISPWMESACDTTSAAPRLRATRPSTQFAQTQGYLRYLDAICQALPQDQRDQTAFPCKYPPLRYAKDNNLLSVPYDPSSPTHTTLLSFPPHDAYGIEHKIAYLVAYTSNPRADDFNITSTNQDFSGNPGTQFVITRFLIPTAIGTQASQALKYGPDYSPSIPIDPKTHPWQLNNPPLVDSGLTIASSIFKTLGMRRAQADRDQANRRTAIQVLRDTPFQGPNLLIDCPGCASDGLAQLLVRKINASGDTCDLELQGETADRVNTPARTGLLNVNFLSYFPSSIVQFLSNIFTNFTIRTRKADSTGPRTQQRFWLIAPEETLAAQTEGEFLSNVFLSQTAATNFRTKFSHLFSPFLTLGGTHTTGQDGSSPLFLQDITDPDTGDVIDTLEYNLRISAASPSPQPKILGRAMTMAQNLVSGAALHRRSSKANFFNTSCSQENTANPTECYWKNLGSPTQSSPAPSPLSAEVNCNPNAPTPSSHNVLPVDTLTSIGFPSDAHDDNLRRCYNHVITRAQTADYDPGLTMAIWLEESAASHYQLYPKVADFGCAVNTPRQDFVAQINCWHSLITDYQTDPQFAECLGPDGRLTLREFFLIYEGGFESCRAGQFMAEPQFPDRIRQYYSLVTGGQQLDFDQILP